MNQGEKYRLIDDFSEYLVNATASTEEQMVKSLSNQNAEFGLIA